MSPLIITVASFLSFSPRSCAAIRDSASHCWRLHPCHSSEAGRNRAVHFHAGDCGEPPSSARHLERHSLAIAYAADRRDAWSRHRSAYGHTGARAAAPMQIALGGICSRSRRSSFGGASPQGNARHCWRSCSRCGWPVYAMAPLGLPALRSSFSISLRPLAHDDGTRLAHRLLSGDRHDRTSAAGT